MGRRALRKVDPNLDLTRHFRESEDLPANFSHAALFECNAPLEVEVGSGKGMFLAEASAEHPDRNFLGIEVARKYARYAAARLAKQQSTNALLICGDALELFQRWF